MRIQSEKYRGINSQFEPFELSSSHKYKLMTSSSNPHSDNELPLPSNMKQRLQTEDLMIPGSHTVTQTFNKDDNNIYPPPSAQQQQSSPDAVWNKVNDINGSTTPHIFGIDHQTSTSDDVNDKYLEL